MAFDVEYARWVEEQNKRVNELRTALNSHASDTELHTMVDNVAKHFNEIFRLKGNAAKADVFHILSGMWKTPAERCFLWIGGFRPSELLKVRPLTIYVCVCVCVSACVLSVSLSQRSFDGYAAFSEPTGASNGAAVDGNL